MGPKTASLRVLCVLVCCPNNVKIIFPQLRPLSSAPFFAKVCEPLCIGGGALLLHHIQWNLVLYNYTSNVKENKMALRLVFSSFLHPVALMLSSELSAILSQAYTDLV